MLHPGFPQRDRTGAVALDPDDAYPLVLFGRIEPPHTYSGDAQPPPHLGVWDGAVSGSDIART